MAFNLDQFIRFKGKDTDPDTSLNELKALDYIESGNFGEGAKEAIAAFVFSKGSFKSHSILYEFFSKAGMRPQQLIVSQVILEKYPENPQACLMYSEALINNNRRSEALNFLRKTFFLFWMRADIGFKIVQLCWQMEDTDFAATASNHLLQNEDIKDKQILQLLDYLIKSKKLNRFVILRLLKRKSVAVKQSLAEVYIRLSDPKSALRVMPDDGDLALSPDLAMCNTLLSVQSHLMLLDLDKAYDTLVGIEFDRIERQTQKHEYLRLAGNICRLSGKLDLAGSFYLQAIELDSKDFLTNYEYIHILEKRGELDGALTFAHAALAVSSKKSMIIDKIAELKSGEINLTRGSNHQTVFTGLVAFQANFFQQPNELKEKINLILKYGALTKCEMVHALFLMGHLKLSIGDFPRALDCWNVGNKISQRSFYSKPEISVAPILTWHTKHDLPPANLHTAGYKFLFLIGLPGTDSDDLLEIFEAHPHLVKQSKSNYLAKRINEYVKSGKLSNNMMDGRSHIPDNVLKELRLEIFRSINYLENINAVIFENISDDLRLARVLAILFPNANFVCSSTSYEEQVLDIYSKPKFNVLPTRLSEILEYSEMFEDNLRKIEPLLNDRLWRINPKDPQKNAFECTPGFEIFASFEHGFSELKQQKANNFSSNLSILANQVDFCLDENDLILNH